jgi:hypothetical protein
MKMEHRLGYKLRRDLIGQEQPTRPIQPTEKFQLPQMTPFDQGLRMAGSALGAYHGWKRNESIGWAIGWGILGAMFPLITSGIAVAQGLSKKA